MPSFRSSSVEVYATTTSPQAVPRAASLQQPSPPTSSPHVLRPEASLEAMSAINDAATASRPVATASRPDINSKRRCPGQLQDRDFRVKSVDGWREEGPEHELQFRIHWAQCRVPPLLIETSSEFKSFVYCAGRRWFIKRVLDDRNPEVWEVEWDVSWRSYEDLPNAAESIDRYESGHQDGASPRDRQPHHDNLPYGHDRLYPGGHLPLGDIPPPGLPHGEATWEFHPEPGKDYALAAIDFFQRLHPEGSHKGHLRRYMLRPTKRGLQFRQEYTKRVNLYRSEQKNATMMLIKGALQPRACNRCREGKGPFLYCVTLTGFGNGACASSSPLIESFHMIAVLSVNHRRDVDLAEHEVAGTDQRPDPPALPNLASRQPALATDASPTHGSDGDITSIEDAEKIGSTEAASVDAEHGSDPIVEDNDSEYHPQSSSFNTPERERHSSLQPAASTPATETTSSSTLSKDVDDDVDWDTPEYFAGHSSPRSTRHRVSWASTERGGSRPLRRTRVGIAPSRDNLGSESSVTNATPGRLVPDPQLTQPSVRQDEIPGVRPPIPPPRRASPAPMTSRNHRTQTSTAKPHSKSTNAGPLQPLSKSMLNKRAEKQPVGPRRSLGKRPRISEDEMNRVGEPPLTKRLAGAASSTIVPAASSITNSSLSGSGPATTPQSSPLNPSFSLATHSEAVPSIASPPNLPLPLHTTPPILVHKHSYFRANEATTRQVRYILAACSDEWRANLHEIWYRFQRTHRGHEVEAYTMEEVLSRFCKSMLNRAVAACCPAAPGGAGERGVVVLE
ncbi:hypothetical protein LTS02_005010 [Friedmanniomyces endolithicus]|nr:hypothetical protein LTS02_005010 [Friedmanniomyces endolithicus]